MIYPRLKALREDRDWTQKFVAEKLDVTRSAYSNYENGLRDLPVELLIKLSELYGVSLEYLLERTDKK